jgi:hemerythrin-like domain-containing protein
MDAIDTLKREHGTCRRVVAAARRRLVEPDQPDVSEIAEFLDFFRYFSHSCHDPKEEDLLFAVLHRRGLSWGGYPLHGLLTDHHAMHLTLDSAADWLPPARAGDRGAVGPLVHNLRVYLDRLTRHMRDEEEVLFPMAEHWLTAEDERELEEGFAAVACAQADDGVHEFYGGLARRLAAA